VLADFTITTHEGRKPMAVRVKVHDNVAALRGAATRYDKHRPKQEQDNSGIAGICHRRHMMGDPLVAIVRLAPPYIGAAMVAHEMAHAAVWMWEIQNKFNRKVALQCDNDEWFCWILGELVRCATVKLYEEGVYTHDPPTGEG
jgi:hypothetical protein